MNKSLLNNMTVTRKIDPRTSNISLSNRCKNSKFRIAGNHYYSLEDSPIKGTPITSLQSEVNEQLYPVESFDATSIIQDQLNDTLEASTRAQRGLVSLINLTKKGSVDPMVSIRQALGSIDLSDPDRSIPIVGPSMRGWRNVSSVLPIPPSIIQSLQGEDLVRAVAGSGDAWASWAVTVGIADKEECDLVHLAATAAIRSLADPNDTEKEEEAIAAIALAYPILQRLGNYQSELSSTDPISIGIPSPSKSHDEIFSGGNFLSEIQGAAEHVAGTWADTVKAVTSGMSNLWNQPGGLTAWQLVRAAGGGVLDTALSSVYKGDLDLRGSEDVENTKQEIEQLSNLADEAKKALAVKEAIVNNQVTNTPNLQQVPSATYNSADEKLIQASNEAKELVNKIEADIASSAALSTQTKLDIVNKLKTSSSDLSDNTCYSPLPQLNEVKWYAIATTNYDSEYPNDSYEREKWIAAGLGTIPNIGLLYSLLRSKVGAWPKTLVTRYLWFIMRANISFESGLTFDNSLLIPQKTFAQLSDIAIEELKRVKLINTDLKLTCSNDNLSVATTLEAYVAYLRLSFQIEDQLGQPESIVKLLNGNTDPAIQIIAMIRWRYFYGRSNVAKDRTMEVKICNQIEQICHSYISGKWISWKPNSSNSTVPII